MNIRDCHHPASSLVICHREGTVVCEECALVIDTQWYGGSNHSESMFFRHRRPYPIENGSENLSDYVRKEASDLLEKVIDCHFLEENLFFEVWSKFVEMMKEKKFRKVYRETLAYCLYLCLKERDSARSLEEIADHFDVSQKRLWKMSSKNNDICPVKPSQILTRLDTTLLTKGEREYIAHASDYFFEKLSIAPKTIIATVWYTSIKGMTMRDVSKICGVSPTSISRTIARLENHDMGISSSMNSV